jgi:pyruvate dehydrogenase E1 component alpha subunit
LIPFVTAVSHVASSEPRDDEDETGATESRMPIKRTKFKLTPEQLLDMYYWLKLIRAFDERLSILVRQGKVRSGVYTGIGQEAIIVGTCFGLRNDDYICPLHRDLGSFLMKGVAPEVMMGQMLGKATGLSKGRDSALHSGVPELGIFGNTSMLGANLPVAAGLAFTYKMEKRDNVVVAFFGEGASNTGDFHEALNFAGVHRLPILFVCENNQYAYSVPVEKSMAIDDVADRAAGYGFDGAAVNGNDVLAVYQASQGALARARRGEGPTLLECKTYRWHGHSEHDKAFYRSAEELAMWKSRDPIPTFTTYLQGLEHLTEDKAKEIEERVAHTIDQAVEAAMQADDPAPEEAVRDVWA